MNKHYYVIEYKFSCWNRVHPHGMTLQDANEYAKQIENSDVIHEMWLDCLEEWPEPGYMNK